MTKGKKISPHQENPKGKVVLVSRVQPSLSPGRDRGGRVGPRCRDPRNVLYGTVCPQERVWIEFTTGRLMYPGRLWLYLALRSRHVSTDLDATPVRTWWVG